jgi:hypothetical protein
VNPWTAIVYRKGKLCGHTTEISPGSWASDCDEQAVFVRADEDGMTEFACSRHAASATKEEN